jgi:hypothetical protein
VQPGAVGQHRVGLLRCLILGPVGETGAVIRSQVASCAPAGYRFPREVIAVAVRWYLKREWGVSMQALVEKAHAIG